MILVILKSIRYDTEIVFIDYSIMIDRTIVMSLIIKYHYHCDTIS